MLFILIFQSLCKYAAHISYWFFIIYILFFSKKLGCKHVIWDKNMFLPALFES